jgi:hypothetical protein
MKKLALEDLVPWLPEIGPVEHLCVACLAGKERRVSFPPEAQYRTEKVLELMHRDLYNKISL